MSNKHYYFQKYRESKKQEMTQGDLHDNFLGPQEPTSHKKKAHASGEGQAITIEGIRIDFPLKPYAAQIQMMTRIIHALNTKENALLESPTGSGKSLALLCAALAWRENQEKLKAAEIASGKVPQKRKLNEEPDTFALSAKKVRTRKESPPSFFSDDDFQQPIVKRFVAEVVQTHEEMSHVFSSDLDDLELSKRSKYETFKAVPRIFVGSRTHKQIAQLVGELKANTRYSPRTTVLGSREHLCIHPKVSKSSSKTDDCTLLLDENRCSYSHKTQKLLNQPSLKTTHKIWDIEDIVQLGKQVHGCPYYAARKLYDGAELIFCPYNYIIDPVIRNILDINLKDSIVILDEAHNIEDASRSAGSIDVDETSLEVMIKELKLVVRFGSEQIEHGRMETVMTDLYDAVRSEDIKYTVKEYERQSCHFTGNELLEKLDQVHINSHTFEDQIMPAYKKIAAHAEALRKAKENNAIFGADDYGLEEIDGLSSQVQVSGTRALSNGSLTVLQGLMTVLEFIFDPSCANAKDYQLVFMRSMRRAGGNANRRRRKTQNQDEPESLWIHKIGFWCLNPAIIFKNMCEKTHSVILTSGTLSPLSTFASELGVEFSGRLEANHVIKPSQVWVSSIPQGPNRIPLNCVYRNIESLVFQDEVGETLCDIVDRVPYGVLMFMPSYKALDLFLDRWKITGVIDRIKEKKLVLSEPKGSDKKEFEKVLNQFYDQIDNVEANVDEENRDGALFFAVFRGKVSEGIDFSNNYCRAVVTLGIPYPGVKDLEVNLKRDYNNRMKAQSGSKHLLSGHEWYEAQAYRAINQALGRCIRHKNDWGAIILLEERFTKRSVVDGLSKWVKGQFQQSSDYRTSMEALQQFISRQVAEDQKKADEEREKRRLQEEATIKIESQSLIIDVDPFVEPFEIRDQKEVVLVEAGEVKEEKEEPDTSILLEKYSAAEQQERLATSTLSRYFNGLEQSDEEPLPTTENTTSLHENRQPSSAASIHGFSDDELPPVIKEEIDEVDQYNNKLDLYSTEREKCSENVDANEKLDNHDHTPLSLNVPFIKLDSPEEHISNNATSSIATDNTTHISCPRCARNLLQGPRNDIRSVEVNDLECIKDATKNRCVVKEIQNPNAWRASTELVGGPLDVQKLPFRETVLYDRIDNLCFRFLACACNSSKDLGMVICLATDPAKMHHVGKVYLWHTQDESTNNTSVKFQQHLLYNNEDLELEIPNSQYSSSNDIFYNL